MFITYYDLSCDIIRLVLKAGRDYDFIYGIPRAGLLPAIMYSSITGIPILTDAGKISTSGKVIILDDSWNNGNTMQQYIDKYGMQNISYGVVYGRSKTPGNIYQAKAIDKGRLFEWEMFTSRRVSWDIDGLMCPDVPKHFDYYAQYLVNAPLMYAPGVKIKCIITSRFEAYRDITEKWLEKNNIKYDHLIMSQRKDRNERKKYGAKDKADACKKYGVKYFLESSDRAAAAISAYGITTISIRTRNIYKKGVVINNGKQK
jgi:hypothetical protein